MNWFLWTLVGLYTVSTVGLVAKVGKPRKPYTPGEAAFGVVYAALVIVGIFLFGAD